MKLLEIKNNLVRFSYESNEDVVLGRFVVLTSERKSYVAQIINFQSDEITNFAVAKLLFIFSQDGLVDGYDGSAPDINSQINNLNTEELLDLLPVQNPINIGVIAQQGLPFNVDMSVLKKNLIVYAQRESDRETFIANTVRQLFQKKEKSVIVDLNNTFDGYEKVVFTKDFKLPLNVDMIEFLYEYEIEDSDSNTKAVIQDIFYNVQQYIKTLQYGFLPIDKFVDVVAAQYKETKMPELALLKNKLLKYKDDNIFANTADDFLSFKDVVEKNNAVIVDLSMIEDALQNEVMYYIRNEFDKIDKYIHYFVNLNNNNSNKKLVKKLLNSNHVFSTLIANSGYKYVQELKDYSHNMILFPSNEALEDYPEFTSFINKMNAGECIVFGECTNNIPFIVSIYDLDLALTKEDVLGDKVDFTPSNETPSQNSTPFEETHLPETVNLPATENILEPDIVEPDVEQEISSFDEISSVADEEQNVVESEDEEMVSYSDLADEDEDELISKENEVIDSDEDIEVDADGDDDEEDDDVQVDSEDITIDEPEGIEDFESDDELYIDENSGADENSLNEDDLDLIDSNSLSSQPNENPPVVPVFPADEEQDEETVSDYQTGDVVVHPRYGRGVVEKIIKYGNKVLCSIAFDNVGRRLLDPSISEFEKAAV